MRRISLFIKLLAYFPKYKTASLSTDFVKSNILKKKNPLLLPFDSHYTFKKPISYDLNLVEWKEMFKEHLNEAL